MVDRQTDLTMYLCLYVLSSNNVSSFQKDEPSRPGVGMSIGIQASLLRTHSDVSFCLLFVNCVLHR